MDKIVILGDSNTYGLDPLTWRRYSEADRYASIVRNSITSYQVIVDGLCGRTTSFPYDVPRGVALECIEEILVKHKPKILFIMLGTNDLKSFNGYNEERLKDAMDKLLNKVYLLNITKNVVIINPPTLSEDIYLKDKDFNEESYSYSLKLGKIYKELANKYSYNYFDSNDYIKVGVDGEHFDKENHHILAKALIEYIKKEYENI